MTTTTTTGPQLAFIASLARDRALTTDLVAIAANYVATPTAFSVRDASRLIDTLKGLPRAVAFKAPVAAAQPAGRLTLSDVPNGKFAIPAHALIGLTADTQARGAYLFVEVRDFNGHHYARRITGAPGDFTRTKIAPADTAALYAILATDWLTYGQTFAREFSCCAVCASPLTDDVSRRLGVGPTCRKGWGL